MVRDPDEEWQEAVEHWLKRLEVIKRAAATQNINRPKAEMYKMTTRELCDALQGEAEEGDKDKCELYKKMLKLMLGHLNEQNTGGGGGSRKRRGSRKHRASKYRKGGKKTRRGGKKSRKGGKKPRKSRRRGSKKR